MNLAAIRLGLSLALLATVGRAQQVAAGAKAVVSSDTLPVYASMSETTTPKATLKKGERVVIGMVLFGSDTTWCAISRDGENKRFGYASCEFLEPENPPRQAPPAAPAMPPVTPPATPPTAPPSSAHAAPKAVATLAPKPAPVTVREIPPAAIMVHEPKPDPVKPRQPEPPASAPAKPVDFIEAVLDGPGLGAELSNYTATTRLSAFLDKGRLAEIDAAGLNRVLSAHFQSRVFLKAIGDQMRKTYAPERVSSLVDWVRSPAAEKLAELERRAYSPVARQDLVEFADTLVAKPPPESRLLLIHRIYDAGRTCDMEVETTIALVWAAAQAINPSLPAEKRYSSNDLDKALGAVKSRYRAVMKNARIVQYLFAYRTAGDSDLEQYAAFLESDSGQWLTAAIDKGFFDATEVISQRLRDEIPRNVKPRK